MTDLHRPATPQPPADEQGSGVASAAADAARETASATTDAGAQVTGAAADSARQVASEVTQQVGDVTREASTQARQLAEQAQQQAREQASSQTKRAATGLQDLGSQVRGLTEGRAEEAGVAADAARALAEKIEALGQRLEQRGFDGTVEDVRDLARRRPGLFLMGAAATGFVVTRLGRGVQAAKQDEQESTQLPGPAAAPVPSPLPTAALGEPIPPPLPSAGLAAPIPSQPPIAPPVSPPLGSI